MQKVIDYYFAPSSPWTFLGHRRFVSLAAQYGAGINIKPVDLLGRVFPAAGGLSVSQRPKQRIAYRAAELKRWRSHLGIQLNLAPKYFPVNCDIPSRMIIAADLSCGPAQALELAGRIMAGVWLEERNIADPDTLTRIAAEAALDSKALLAMADQPVVGDRYAEYTQEAIDKQVFGAPFYIYRDEPLWGQDRLDFLERALQAP